MTRDEIMGMTDAELKRNVIEKLGLYNLPWDFDPAIKIQDAFKVVEKLMRDGFLYKQFGNESCGNLLYSVYFAKEDDGYGGHLYEYKSGITENSLPRAICLAALLAVTDNRDV